MKNQHTESESPRLRHEFVGMMFAVAIGEVGLQAAALVQADNFIGHLPALGHLILATAIIATSWVGWSVSRTRGGRQDVTGIFQWEFFVLLLDVSMVITYFILVRAFEFEHKGSIPRIDPSSKLAFWIGFIFILYLLWDFITKVLISQNEPHVTWWQKYGRMFPTIACLIIVWIVWDLIRSAKPLHYLTADFALLCLIFLFRALKDLVSAITEAPRDVSKIRWATGWTLACVLGLLFGVSATWRSWDWFIPGNVAQKIQSAPIQP